MNSGTWPETETCAGNPGVSYVLVERAGASGVPRVGNQFRLTPYGTLLNKVVGGLRRLLW